MDYTQFNKYAKSKFRSVKTPSALLSDSEFISIFNAAYFNSFLHLPKISGCGVCLYEFYREISDLTEKQIQNIKEMEKAIKEGKILFASDGRPYSRQSVNITPEIQKELEAKYPGSFEKRPEEKPIKYKTRVDDPIIDLPKIEVDEPNQGELTEQIQPKKRRTRKPKH